MSKQDFEKFLALESESPPAVLTERILAKVEADLQPRAWLTLMRLAGVHLLSALVTLAVCPQFGWRYYGEGHGLVHIFSRLGTYGCVVACGFFFLGTTFFLASWFLHAEELLQLRRNRWLGSLTLVLLSLGFFTMIEAEVVLGLSLFFWAVGAVLGGVLSLELGFFLRERLVSVE